MVKAKLPLSLLLLFILTLSGCAEGYYPFLYRQPLEQGNILNSQNIEQIRLGMSKEDVINILGQPVLQTPFDADTWHYVYLLRQDGKEVKKQHLDLYFAQGKVIRIAPEV